MQPFLPNPCIDNLEKKDFHNFYLSFKEVVEESVPAFENLYFFHSLNSALNCLGSSSVKEEIENFFSVSLGKTEFYHSDEKCVFLAIPTQDSVTLAVLTGLDPYFIHKVAEDWLSDLCRSLLERFLMVKKAGSDLETGLLNSQSFYITLQQQAASVLPSVMLVEVSPRARSAKEAKTHALKAASSLNGCINGKLPLYYLGHNVFGLVANTLEEEMFFRLGKSLLSYLRRDGFSRAHIGLRKGTGKESVKNGSANFGYLVDEAWFALQAARKRGPYSLCDHDFFSHPEKHPLRRPTKSLLAKFRRKWLRSESFSVVQFLPEDSKDIDLVKTCLQDESVISEGEDVYVFLDGLTPEKAMKWAASITADMAIDDIRVGVGYYPHNSFTKSATVMNCRKALHHAAFLGKKGTAVFDAVSLNVSGDIYYAEGNLTSAVQEYRRGLDCDPGNINLLNSLGVAYADMSKHKEAHKCFKMVLSLVPDNFMALFNLGLGEELAGREGAALEYFETASQTSQEILDDIQYDLQFNLGKLYCKTGQYRNAAEILKSWYDSSSGEKNKDRALQYLGKALYGQGRLEEAMICLQRALRFNEFDADSMGLLGLIYLLRQEGDDIALSLCRNSVELNPGNIELSLYLAKAEIACGRFKEAKINLKKCLRNKVTRVEAQLSLCICYHKEGSQGRAKYWLGRVLKNTSLEPGISAQAHEIREELDGKKW